MSHFGEKIAVYRQEMVEHLCELVRIKSVSLDGPKGMPFGEGPRKALDYALQLARSLGFTAVDVDGYAGYAEYGEGEDYIAVITHLDVVPEGAGWNDPPYSATIRDGVIYGRGVSDNKCGVIASLYALKMLKEEGVPFRHRIRLIFGCSEETGMADMDYYFQKEPYPVFGFSPDSGYPIVNGEKGILDCWLKGKVEQGKIRSISSGEAFNVVPDFAQAVLSRPLLTEEEVRCLRQAADQSGGVEAGSPADFRLEETDMELVVSAYGKTSHGADPEAGVNALLKLIGLLSRAVKEKRGMARFLEGVAQRIGTACDGAGLGIACDDAQSGPLTVNAGGMVRIQDGEIAISLDIRYPISADGENLLMALRQSAEECGLDAELERLSPPLNVPGDSPWIGLLADAYREMTGKEAELVTIGGGTYSRKSNNTCVGFGSAGSGAHHANESLKIDDFIRHASIMTQALFHLIQKE